MLACSGRGPPSRGGQGAGPFCPRPLWARLGCPSAVLLRGGRWCHSAGPLPTSAASSQDSFCSPARFLLLFDSARPVLLALAVVPLQASPGGERLLPSGRRAGRLRGRTSPRRAALSWPFSSSPGAFVFLAGCGGPFLSCFCLLFLLPWMFVAFPHGECAERKAALTRAGASRCRRAGRVCGRCR